MPKQKLFDDDSDDEVAIKTENEYAKKYDAWREKEELHKLEQKYGSKSLNSDGSVSDSEDESDEPPEVSEEMEEQFLKTLALLKTKDPRIYDPNYKFFEDKQKETVKEEKKPTLTFADSDDEDDGDIFTIEKKAEVEPDDKPSTSTNKVGKEGKIKEYLIGKKEHIDSPIEKELAPLKALWSDPNINEGEAFLRDYILNKKYLEEGELGEAEGRLRDDDDLEADEQTVEEQGNFERAYNFRFEEPDHEYLKRYPRTMNYIRPKDDRRSRARAELRARKEADKRRKMDDIQRLKALKLKEIQDKIARIKEVTGNDELAFKEDDIEGDFDPLEHDRRMRAIFDDQYYGHEDHEKPVFPDLDEELEIENWDNYDPESEKIKYDDDGDESGPHCEDDDFNMDADYDPKQSRANLLEQIQQTLGKKRRHRKKKSKLAKLLEGDKPKFIPTEANKTYDQFMEEYYKMDCEDIIGGDLPTRFKYREVVPNDYGLTVEEILLADDKELTQWVPLKKIVKHRPESVQKSEINTYRMKAADIDLKRKVLPSLFKDLPEEPEVIVPQENKKKKKKNKQKETEVGATLDNETNVLDNTDENGEATIENDEMRIENDKMRIENDKMQVKNDEMQLKNDEMRVKNDEMETENYELQVQTKKSKKKKRKQVDNDQKEIPNISSIVEDIQQNDTEGVISKKKKAKQKQQEIEPIVDDNEQKIEVEVKSKKKHKNIEHTDINLTNNTKENGVDKKKRKKIKNKEFNVVTVENATPSHDSQNIQPNKNKKRKLDNNTSEIPNKKTKNNTQNVNRKKEHQNNKGMFKMNKDKFKTNKYKFKHNKDKFKNKQQTDKSDDNPLSKLSDERLKAYGLNPKKYRSFLKYKKF